MQKPPFWIAFLLVIFLGIPFHAIGETRSVQVLQDLSRKSGKLGAYRALIIGINDYQDPKIPDLETPVNDATAMAEVLESRYGFKTELLLNREATKEAIYEALRRLASSTEPDDSVLIYYAGHGDLDRTFHDGWWIPVDAKAGNPVTYLDNVLVQKAMASMPARHVLLISDSCYSGTLFGTARAMPPVMNDRYYINLYNEKSRWGMTSGNKTPVSDSGSGGHSVFAYELLKELQKNEKPYISTQEIYTQIAPVVSNNSEQTPLCRPIRNTGDEGGEFVFVANSDGSTPAYKSIPVEAEPAPLPPEGRASLDGPEAQVTGEDGPFVAYATGVVYDKDTGLEWYAGPDKGVNWNEASAWVQRLRVAGGGWRIPTRDELRTLYQKGAGTRNMTPLLKTTGWLVWAEPRDASHSAWSFYFKDGDAHWFSRSGTHYSKMRGFAVRSRRQ